MKKKFKNMLSIKGSLPLLKAFVEEIRPLGYTGDGISGNPEWVATTHLLTNYSENTSNYGYHNHGGSGTSRGFINLSLPQDWNKALKLVAELSKVIPEYVKLLSGFDNKTTGKIFKTTEPVPRIETWSKDWTWEYLFDVYPEYFVASTKEEFEIQQVIVPEYVEWVNYIGSEKVGTMCNKSDFVQGKVFCTSTDELPSCGLESKVSNWAKALTKNWYAHAFIPSTKAEYERQQTIQPKPGNWYGSKTQKNLLVYCTRIDENSIFGYGFTEGQGFDENTSNPWFTGAFRYLRETTEEEVKEKLLAEAVKRYLVGSSYLSASSGTKEKVVSGKFSVPNLQQVYGEIGKGCLFHNGKWAEVIDQSILVKGYTVVKVDKDSIKVGCKTFENTDLYNLYNFLQNHDGVYRFDEQSWNMHDLKLLINFIEQK